MKRLCCPCLPAAVLALLLAGCAAAPGRAPQQPPAGKTQAIRDLVPMVMVNGNLYYDTGDESAAEYRCCTMDGQITSSVDGAEIPAEDGQSNFGTGFPYQYGAGATLEVFINEKWVVFAQQQNGGVQTAPADAGTDVSALPPAALEQPDRPGSPAGDAPTAANAVPAADAGTKG